uniref:Uncharacterized protein n=1 Tax=Arundo donax TaxID=35708 RepID=A0A0A9HJP4_ARUDO
MVTNTKSEGQGIRCGPRQDRGKRMSR